MFEKAIIHMDLDTFFVSCERLINPKLENKPVLIGGTSDRGVVASCSYEARKFGVHAAMPMRLAKRLCSDATIIRGDSGLYSRYSNIVTGIIKDSAPMYEKSSIDEFYIDMTGMERFHGCYSWATGLREKIIKETNLPISFGLSANKTVSKVGTGEAKPNGQIQIPIGSEKPFLSPLSVRKIPMVGEKTYEILRSLGVGYIKTVQEMPIEMLQRVLGKRGTSLWKKAQGLDNTPVIPYHEQKSISKEKTFERDTADTSRLNNIMISMAESLAFQLRDKNKLTSCITVKIRYADFNTHSKQARIPYTACDHSLVEKTKDLFNGLYKRRLLIRLIGVKYSHLVGGGHQVNMFEDTEDIINLYVAMDHLRKRFGQNAIKRACAIDSKIVRLNPFNEQ